MSYYDKEVHIDFLVGLKIADISGLNKGSEEVLIETECGKQLVFKHFQDCCESVQLEDIDCSCDDFVGSEILSASEVTNMCEGERPSDYSESWTWTFYSIQTSKGYFHMRWLGESNGYYSESVELYYLNKPNIHTTKQR